MEGGEVMDEACTRDWDLFQPGRRLHQLLPLSQGRVREVSTGVDWEGLQQGSQGRTNRRQGWVKDGHCQGPEAQVEGRLQDGAPDLWRSWRVPVLGGEVLHPAAAVLSW